MAKIYAADILFQNFLESEDPEKVYGISESDKESYTKTYEEITSILDCEAIETLTKCLYTAERIAFIAGMRTMNDLLS